jgi:hypothetical protein
MANLTANYPDLNAMFGNMSMLPAQLGMQQWNQAQQNEEANMAAALQNLAFNEEMNPLKVREKGLTNMGLEADLPGKQATSSLLQDKAKVSRDTLGLQLDAESAKLLEAISADEAKQIENMFQKMAYSNDPVQRQIGIQGLEFSKTVLQEKTKQKYMSDRQEGLERIRGKNQKELMQMQIDAGRFKKGGGNIKTAEQALANAKSARERHQMLIDLATVAQQDGNDQLYESYMARAEAVRPQAEAEIKNLSPRPGDPALDKLNIPTNPNLTITPPGKERATEQTQLGSPETYKKAFGTYEPNKYEYRMGPNGVPQRRLKGQ